MRFTIAIDGVECDEIEAKDQTDADTKCFNAARNHFIAWGQPIVVTAHPVDAPPPSPDPADDDFAWADSYFTQRDPAAPHLGQVLGHILDAARDAGDDTPDVA